MPENSSGTSKLLWMVIGAVVTGLIGIPVSYVVGIFNPSAHLGISVATSNDRSSVVERFAFRALHPPTLTILVSNTTRFLATKQTAIRVNMDVFGRFFELPSENM